jgi:FkbM family methyltransferase
MPSAYETKALIRNLLAHAGLHRYRRPDVLANFLRRSNISVVLDVGANAGQFGRNLRAMGYRGRLVSFEPLSRAFHKLHANAATISQWQPVQLALGDTDETRSIHVSGNSYSSSFRDMLPRHVSAAPKSAYVGEESVPVRRLDGIVDDYCTAQDRIFLKIDVQGFEDAVLRGAETTVARCVGLQLELSITPLYQGGLMLPQMLGQLAGRGFVLLDLKPACVDPKTGELLQVDGLFYRSAGA